MIDFNSYRTANGTLVFRISGQLEHQSSEYFFRCVADAIEDGNNRIVINFAEVGYVSSMGLGALIRARSKAGKAGCKIYLTKIENQLLDLFRLVKFDTIFNIYGTEQDAVAAIERGVQACAPC